jgi:uracil-DNA glycosylase
MRGAFDWSYKQTVCQSRLYPSVVSHRMRRIPLGSREMATLQAVRRAVIQCERCPRLRAYCRRIARARKREFRDWTYWGRPVPGFGDPRARLLVVGLAPAAHGGNRTGRVFTGDSSGDWLYEALHRFGFASQAGSVSRHDGLRLMDCYIDAAARCAPPDNKPTPRELAACRPYLEAEIRLLRHVRVVLTLGRVALESYLKAAALRLEDGRPVRPRFAHGLETRLPGGTILLCSFHPSRRNTNTGLLTRAMWHDVFRRARRVIDGAPVQSPRSRAPGPDLE